MKISLAALLLFVSLAAFLPQDGLKSKDPLERLAAVDQVEAGERGAGGKLLVKLFKDDDWEVVERAAKRLGEIGTADQVGDAVDLALEGPVRRVRAAAAHSAAKLDADKAAESLLGKARGKTALLAAEALAIVAPSATAEAKLNPRALESMLKEKDGRLRAAGAAALLAVARTERAEVLKELLESEYLMVRATAAEVAAATAEESLLAPLIAHFERDTLDPVVERRLRRAIIACLAKLEPTEKRHGDADALVRKWNGAKEAVAARGARLVRELAAQAWSDSKDLLASLSPALQHQSPAVRAQAAAVLKALPGEAARDQARALALADGDVRVRRAATAAAFALSGEDGVDSLEFALARLEAEKDALAREDLVVQLGRRGLEGAVEPLIKELGHPDWRVRVAAAVSLGKTRLASAQTPLEKQRREATEDWRARAAAVVGLAQLYRADAVPQVIDSLVDPEALIRRLAHVWLIAATNQTLPAEVEPWRTWWAANGSRVALVDMAEREEREKRYGYASAPPEAVYRGLDVLVLESRGDHVQDLLEQLNLQHRLSQAGRVRTDGPDPRGVFVANCTGEIQPADAEILAFFLHAGGYLFGSCWAVEETIARIAPGDVRRLVTKDEVLDSVRAFAAAPGSPYLEGVFVEGAVPIYELQGAYLIDVLAPERVEVLVDSPEAAERWGGGELAAWFRVGHGVVLDSVNHFDVQGLELALGLKKPEERQAYAVDHMGYTYADLRKTRDEEFWETTPKAANAVPDLSVFRLITNFVRLRRLAGD